jgi:Ca2+-binding RTX toxin-like protein
VRPVVLVAVLLALPAPAAHAAATVSAISRTVTDPDGVSTSFGVVAIGDGAADELTAEGVYVNFGVVLGAVVRDPAGVIAAQGCEQVDPTTARCTVPENQQGLATVTATLSGGAGDDVLHGGDIARVVYGGHGSDRLLGGPGGNRLYGGAGRDRLRAGSGHDLLVGGSGGDTLSRVGRGDVVRARDRGRDVVRCVAPPRRLTLDRRDVVFGCAG